MLMAISYLFSRSVKATLVIWLPWSRVEDHGLAVLRQRLLDGLDAERRGHADREPPSQHLATEPVDQGREINEATRHGGVGDVDRLHLVGPRGRQLAQEIRIDPVALSRLRVFGRRQIAVIPIRSISVATWSRPTSKPSRTSKSRIIRLPANG